MFSYPVDCLFGDRRDNEYRTIQIRSEHVSVCFRWHALVITTILSDIQSKGDINEISYLRYVLKSDRQAFFLGNGMFSLITRT